MRFPRSETSSAVKGKRIGSPLQYKHSATTLNYDQLSLKKMAFFVTVRIDVQGLLTLQTISVRDTRTQMPSRMVDIHDLSKQCYRALYRRTQ